MREEWADESFCLSYFANVGAKRGTAVETWDFQDITVPHYVEHLR